MTSLLQIPPLGKHYSQRWAQEDLLEEQKDGARAAAVADKKKGLMGPLTELDTKGKSLNSLSTPGQGLSSQSFRPPSALSLAAADVDALLKKSEAQHEQPEDGCPFGALTQRLLQALVEVSTQLGSELQARCVGICLQSQQHTIESDYGLELIVVLLHQLPSAGIADVSHHT